MRIKFRDENEKEYFLRVGVAYGDKGSSAPAVSQISVYIEELATDLFDFFREHRGSYLYPVKSDNITDTERYIKILTNEEALQADSPATIIVSSYGSVENASAFFEYNIVIYDVYTPEMRRPTRFYAMAKNAVSEYADWLFSENKTQPSAPYSSWSKGIGLWYIPNTDFKNHFLSFGGCYTQMANTKATLTNTGANFNCYPPISIPTIVAYNQGTFAGLVTLKSQNVFVKALGGMATYYHSIFGEAEDNTFQTYFNTDESMAIRFFLRDVSLESNGGYPEGGDPSIPEGGGGGMYDPSDPIPLDPIPSSNIGGLINVYKLSSSQLQDIHNFLWSEDFKTTLLSITQSPFECVVGLCSMPYNAVGTSANINFGNLDSGIGASKISSQFHEVNCGTLQINEFWGSFLDYAPYTQLSLYLPYIGTVDIDTDSFMNNTLQIIYRIDIISGACVAILINSNGVVDSYSGNLATQLPLSMNDKSSAYASTLTSAIGAIGSVASGNVGGAISSTASMVSSLKTHPHSMSSYNANKGAMLNNKPYLIISRPKANIPADFANNKGLRSNITRKLSNAKGFCVVDKIHLDGVTCTTEEKTQIETYLKNGVII